MLVFMVTLSECRQHRRIDYQQCIKEMTNGCSVPNVGKKNIYASTIFLPACQKHDVCYECGTTLDWKRSECDKAFYKDMMSICNRDFSTKRGMWSWVSKGWSGMKIGALMAKWMLIPAGTYEKCSVAADIFYKGVHNFGSSYFGAETVNDRDKVCYLPCTNPYGNPKHSLKRL